MKETPAYSGGRPWTQRSRAARILVILFGNFLLGIGIEQIVLRNGFIAGGVTGVGVLLSHFLPVSKSTLVGVLTVLVFLIGSIVLGREFALNTVVSALSFPLFIKVSEHFTLFPVLAQDNTMACLVAAVIIGAGVGLVVRNNASTAGLDIIALTMNKYFGTPVAPGLAVCDVAVIVLQLLVNRTPNAIYGIVTVLLTSAVMNRTLVAGQQKVQVLIITPRAETLRDELFARCDCGLSFLPMETGLNHTPQKAAMVVIPYKILARVRRVIDEVDPCAFVIISEIQDVRGRGFSMER